MQNRPKMADESWDNEPKVRITPTMLKSGRYNGKIVTLLGLIDSSDFANQSAVLDIGEKTKVNVKFNCEAIEVENCYAQLICRVVNPKEVQCVYHTVFPPDMTAKMDIDYYLRAVTLFTNHMG
ncbi:hypothetical protein T4B_12847 [Trichinella pseudospiralis]|uniref:Replication protein A 14 kDa subunit n=2 Tax=Trichinella pseudospiralis TaxID=6337 RepID=A0A0V1IUY4_TRIPS|nr:hypothetical protein T4B_12847 [Trichinella pseudospiralis]